MRAVALGPGLGRSDGTEAARAPACSRSSTCRSWSTRTRSGSWSRSTRDRADDPHAARGRARRGCSASRPAGSPRTASTRSRRAVERFGCIVLLKGADTLVGAPGEQPLVVSGNAPALAAAGTGDVLTGIIAAFLAKGVEPRLAAAAGAVAAPARRALQRPAARARRRRRRRGPSRGARCTALRSPSTSAPCAGTSRTLLARARRRASCGRWSRRTATATVPWTSPARRSRRARRCSASQRSPRALELRAGYRDARILVMGPWLSRDLSRGARGRARARRASTARCRRASASTSSSTAAWAAGASPSCLDARRRASSA